jgi:hypothetical protein
MAIPAGAAAPVRLLKETAHSERLRAGNIADTRSWGNIGTHAVDENSGKRQAWAEVRGRQGVVSPFSPAMFAEPTHYRRRPRFPVCVG